MTFNLDYWIVDAFADTLFTGNPAAVCWCETELTDALCQSIAAEFNLSETAFVNPLTKDDRDGDYGLRWFTPMVEVDLCGHATLAAAHAILQSGRTRKTDITFHTRVSGLLKVTHEGDQRYAMDFPMRPGKQLMRDQVPDWVIDAVGGGEPESLWRARDLMCVYPDADRVRAQKPDFQALRSYPHWIIVTAPGDQPGQACVSRFYCAGDGIDEDPVTGSAHCTIAPYWMDRLGVDTLTAYQASQRGGTLHLTRSPDDPTRLIIKGAAITAAHGQLVGLSNADA